MSGNMSLWSIYKGKREKKPKICALDVARVYRFILLAIASETGCAEGYYRVIQKDQIRHDITLKRFNISTNPKPRSSSTSGDRS